MYSEIHNLNLLRGPDGKVFTAAPFTLSQQLQVVLTFLCQHAQGLGPDCSPLPLCHLQLLSETHSSCQKTTQRTKAESTDSEAFLRLRGL